MRSLFFLLLSTCLFLAACTSPTDNDPPLDSGWVNVPGDTIPVYIGQFQGYEEFDAQGMPHGTHDYNDDNEWTVLPYNPATRDSFPPVVLSSFTASLTADMYVRLTWVTQSETNMSCYYLLRAETDNLVNAETISPLIPATNTSQIQTYQYTDTQLYQAGTYYYWLKMVEMDGTSTYAGPVIVNYSGTPPVVLSSFTATLTADLYVTITWVTESETNMVGYRVYRNTSPDQATAELIDHPFVPAHNTSSTYVYSVTDEDVTVGTYYYWLESVEYNTSDFHGPVMVEIVDPHLPPPPPQVNELLAAYPNPSSTWTLKLVVKGNFHARLLLINSQGGLVHDFGSFVAGSHTLHISAQVLGLTTDLYRVFAWFEGNGEQYYAYGDIKPILEQPLP